MAEVSAAVLLQASVVAPDEVLASVPVEAWVYEMVADLD